MNLKRESNIDNSFTGCNVYNKGEKKDGKIRKKLQETPEKNPKD